MERAAGDTLASLRGQVVLVNLWASWCPPCLEEMPSLERLHQQLGGQGLLVVGVSEMFTVVGPSAGSPSRAGPPEVVARGATAKRTRVAPPRSAAAHVG